MNPSGVVLYRFLDGRTHMRYKSFGTVDMRGHLFDGNFRIETIVARNASLGRIEQLTVQFDRHHAQPGKIASKCRM